jgi:hypothetical protein
MDVRCLRAESRVRKLRNESLERYCINLDVELFRTK